MKRTSLMARMGVVAAAGALVLTGCSSSDDSGDDGNDANAESSESAESSADECKTIDNFKKEGDGELKIGTFLPQTGSLAFLGPPEFAGVNLAIKEINAAGGALGKKVVKVDSDSGDAQNPSVANQSSDRLINQNVDAVVGAASSAVSLLAIDKFTQNGVLQFSPANTADQFSTYCDQGLYFRTAPPDTLQGRVLSDVILNDGNATVGILALQDAYGTGLADHVESNVTAGNGQIVKKVVYDPKAANYATEVGEVKAEDPDAVVLIGFDETKKIIPELVTQGIGPDEKKIYMVDGNLSDYSADFKAGTLGPNAKGTLPGVQTTGEFQKRVLGINPKLKDFSYTPESYDATIVIALSAIAADSDNGPDMAKVMPDVTREGTKCDSFADCKKLLEDGEDIDYEGASGPIDMLDNGDPGSAFMGVYQFKEDGTYEFLEAQQGDITEEDIK